MEKKVSVIIPVYNSEAYLSECLDSLVYQDLDDAEFICINDGSTDSSLQICTEYSKKDKRFVILSQENSGPAKARNTGLDNANGKYICFLDSDDCLSEGALSKLYALAESKNYDIIVHGSNVITDDGAAVPDWVQKNIAVEDREILDFKPKMTFQIVGCRPFLWAHFIRRSLISDNNLWINEKLRVGEDQAFEILYFSLAKKVLFIQDKLYNYRVSNGNSIMATYEKKKLEKMDQHLEMVKTVTDYYVNSNLISDVRGCLIHWVLETFYWDLLGLLYHDQLRYIETLLGILNDLRIDYCYGILTEMDLSMYEQMKIIYDNREDPQKIIDGFSQLRETKVEQINKIQGSMFYKIGKKLLKK